MELFLNPNKAILRFIVDIVILNLTHVILSFVILFYYNRENDVIGQFKEKHGINLPSRLIFIFIFYSVFFLTSYFTRIPWLKELDRFVFTVLALDHAFQQSKGLFLKKIKEHYSPPTYSGLKKYLDLLKWSLIAFITIKYLSKLFFDSSEDKIFYIIYYLVTGSIFAHLFYVYIYKRDLLLKLFSARFFLIIMSLFATKFRGFYHGVEYGVILSRINKNYFSHLNDYKKIIATQILVFTLFVLLAVVVYSMPIMGNSSLSFMFAVFKSLSITHYALDHYLFTQRYIPARQITAVL